MGVNSLKRIYIEGGRKLKGSVRIQGSKNAALPMMAASLLHRGVSVLRGCPKIADVFCMEEILKKLGAKTWWKGHDLYLDCSWCRGQEISSEDTGKMRSSVILLGAVTARNKRGKIGYPGGCVIGKRPIDLHLYALRCLGVKIREEENFVEAECRELTGGEISFSAKSVGATEQGILSVVTARGRTIIKNCAEEPEILWLCRYLRRMGARISGEETGVITIDGVPCLKGGDMQVPPDRIVAGTYICAAAATRGKIEILNPPEGELNAFLQVYRKIGGQYEVNSGKLIVDAGEVNAPADYVETGVYPGFPTDLQSPLMAVLLTVPGKSRIRESIFEARYKAAEEMKRMGAQIQIRERDAFIDGGVPLTGCTVKAQELRGGAALILAALACKGTSCIEGCSFIERGYEHICEDLNALGGALTED